MMTRVIAVLLIVGAIAVLAYSQRGEKKPSRELVRAYAEATRPAAPATPSPAQDETTRRLQKLLADATEGKAEAQFALAEQYRLGTLLRYNEEEARRWYGKAAAQGHAGAQRALEEMDRTPAAPAL